MVYSTSFQFVSLLICETTYFNLRKVRNDVIFCDITSPSPERYCKMCSYATHIASFLTANSCTRTKCKMATTLGLMYENWSWTKMKVGYVTTWKELTTGVQQLVRLLFNNNSINLGLVFYRFLSKVYMFAK